MKSRILHIFNILLCLSLIILGSCGPIWPADLQVRVKRVAYRPLHRPWIHVFISVFTENGRAVTGLDESRFLIEEDGRFFSGSKEVESFVASGRSLAYIIALDTRENLPTSLTLVSEGVKSLISEMGFRNPGAILVYTGRPEVLAGPTRNADLLMKKADGLAPGGGRPHLFDGLLLAAKELDGYAAQAESKPDELVLFLLTDGLDKGSRFSLDAGAARIIESNISLFVVGYGNRESRVLSRLARVAVKTGGSFFFAHAPDEIGSLSSAVAARLKNQYVLTYRARKIRADGQAHTICIQVEKDGARGQDTLKFIAPNLGKERSRYLPFGLGLGVIFLAVLALLLRGRFKAR